MELDPAGYHFTWPDRGLAYDCAGCSACCRGLGIGVDAAGGQLVELCEAYPELVGFVRRRGAAHTLFNPRGRCWFLDDGGLCRVERERGRRAKPASCRLFPFNRVFRLGPLMVVDYNAVVCPLAPAEGASGVSHGEVVAEIAEIADPAVIGTPLEAEEPAAEAAALAAREGPIAAACFAAAAADPPDLAAGWAAQAGAAEWVAAGEALSRATDALLGQPLAAPAGATAAAALLATPSLRFNELYGPRRYAPRAALVELMPRLWRAWLHFAAMGARLARRDLTLQEVTSAFTEVMPLGYLAARWDEPCALAPGPVELPGEVADPTGVVRRFGERCVANRDRRRSLGELFGPLMAEQRPPARVALARLIEPLLPRLDFGDRGASAGAGRARPAGGARRRSRR